MNNKYSSIHQIVDQNKNIHQRCVCEINCLYHKELDKQRTQELDLQS